MALLIAQHCNTRYTINLTIMSEDMKVMIALLWEQLLPGSFYRHIHSVKNLVVMSSRHNTFQRKCQVIKEYFDTSREEIMTHMRKNKDLIQLIFSKIYPQIFYSSDNGMDIANKMKQLLASRRNQVSQKEVMTYFVPPNCQPYKSLHC